MWDVYRAVENADLVGLDGIDYYTMQAGEHLRLVRSECEAERLKSK